MKKYAFGVDVGGTTCKIGFFETDGKLIDKWEIKTNKENGGASILPDVAQAIEGKLTEKGISRDDVQGIGVGVPGPVKNDGVVHRCVNVGWGVVNVEKELGDLTGLKVKAGNDANVAALGEMWQGAAKGCKRKSRNIPSHKAASYKGGCGKIRKYRSSGICHIAVEFGCGCALWCVVRNSQGKMAGLYRNDDCGLRYFAPLVLDRLFADYAVCGKTANSADNKRNEPEKSDYAVYYAWRRNCSRDRTIYKILHY